MRELEQFAESVARMSSQPTMLEHRATVESVSEDGVKVRIDGAESSTICTTWLASCHVGDRVLVTIDPHRRCAVVKGNISNVPISSADAVDDYALLSNKPSIEGVTLIGDKTLPDLGIFIDAGEQYPASDDYALTNMEIDALWNAST